MKSEVIDIIVTIKMNINVNIDTPNGRTTHREKMNDDHGVLRSLQKTN